MEQIAHQKEEITNLLMEITEQFESETPPAFTNEQAKVIAAAFYLLADRANITSMQDQLIMLLANRDPELEWAQQTFKNLARFLNVCNHPSLIPPSPHL